MQAATTPGRKLQWDGDIGSAMQGEQRAATLQTFCGIQERVVLDAGHLLGLFGGEDRPARGRLAAHKLDKAGRRS